jgi:hypothetical protein
MNGGDGDDFVDGDIGADVIHGGIGYDTCSNEDAPAINCENVLGNAETPPPVIPPGHYPPPGSCRLWFLERPPGHQPPPESCSAAEEKRDYLDAKGEQVAVIDGG